MKLTQFNARLIFSQLLCQLVRQIEQNGYQVSVGEVLRMNAQQVFNVKNGLSKTMDSYHLKGLAVDLNIFKNGKVITLDSDFKLVAQYWESLHVNCRAGYYWGWDKLHYEFQLDTAKRN